jgi:hypothetical protein
VKVIFWGRLISQLIIVSVITTGSAFAAKPLIEGGNEVGFAVLASDGSAWGWGENSGGELGNETGIDSSTPVRAAEIANIADLSIDDFYNWTAVALNDGTVWVWGDVLGRVNHYIPHQISAFTDIVDVAAGPWPMAAVRSDGTLWEYELRSIYSDDEPRQIEGVTNAVAVAVSMSSPYVLLNDGTVWTWEQVTVYDESLEANVLVDQLTQIEGLLDIVQIDGGFNHVIALRADGTVWAWGNNSYGQLGDGSLDSSTSARQVQALTGVYDISAGNRQSAAVRSDGTVWTWGRWRSGLTEYEALPEQVSGYANAVQVSVGRGYGGLVLNSDGDVTTYDGLTVSAIPSADGVGSLNTGPIQESQMPTACRPTYFMDGRLHLPCVSLGEQKLFDVELSLQPEGNLRFSVDTAQVNPLELQSMRDCTVRYTNGEANIPCLVAMDVSLGLDDLLNVVLSLVPDSDPDLQLDVTSIKSY